MRLLSTIFIIFSVVSTACFGEVPQLVNFQGKLFDSEGNARSGAVSLSFEVYDAASGGNLLWGPQTFDSVSLTEGYFNVILSIEDATAGGETIDVAFSEENTFLQIIDGDTPISPRQQILSVPYAINALHGVPAGAVMPFNLDACPSGWSEFVQANDRFILGKGAKALGETGGEERVTLTVEEMPRHNHAHRVYGTGSSSNNPTGTVTRDSTLYNFTPTEHAGGSQSHNNMPPYISLLYCSKD